MTRFPASKYAADAAARMKYLVNVLASHEVHVARYYMKRAAYVAAVGRAQYAVQQYPQAPAVEKALGMMVQAYQAMGLDDLQNDTLRVLNTNFQNSLYLSGITRSEKPW